MDSKSLFERSLLVAPGGVHSPVRSFRSVGGNPLFFKKASGAYLETVEGQKLVDFCMSFGPLILGHRDSAVEKKVIEQIHTAWTFGACEPYSLHLAEWVREKIPWVEKLRFVSSGTEAVMSALRVARAATGRSLILKFDGCYHGHVDSMLVKSGSGLAGLASSDSAGVSSKVASETLVVSLNDDKGLESVFEKYGSEIAAVIIEPLPANYGLLIQKQEFLEKIAKLCKSHGSLLIFDEVISGFRVSLGGMAELTKIKPDLVTYGKVLGGGFNVGCYGGRKDLLDLVAPSGPVYQAGTLSANPIGMVAGLATLQKAVELNLYEVLGKRTKKFADLANQAFESEKLNLQMITAGSLFWIHEKTKEPIRNIGEIPPNHGAEFALLFKEALKEDIYLAPSGYEVGFTSWAHTDEILTGVATKLAAAAGRAKKIGN